MHDISARLQEPHVSAFAARQLVGLLQQHAAHPATAAASMAALWQGVRHASSPAASADCVAALLASGTAAGALLAGLLADFSTLPTK